MSRSLTNDQLHELRQGNGSFGSAVAALKQGYIVKRVSYSQNKAFFIQDAPNFIKKQFEKVDFRQIVLIFGNALTENSVFDKYYFSDSDILAEDWTTIE